MGASELASKNLKPHQSSCALCSALATAFRGVMSSCAGASSQLDVLQHQKLSYSFASLHRVRQCKGCCSLLPVWLLTHTTSVGTGNFIVSSVKLCTYSTYATPCRGRMSCRVVACIWCKGFAARHTAGCCGTGVECRTNHET